MAELALEGEEVNEAVFDVVVRMPSNAKLEVVEQKAIEAGIRPDRVEALVKVLRSVPQAKIGASVNAERAEKAREQFTKAGLIVEVTPVLSLSAVTAGAMDGTSVCPACNTRVVLTKDRQCPNCGVYVDKVGEEAQIRRKIMEQERGRADFEAQKQNQKIEKDTRASLEASIRAQVRKELRDKYGSREEAGLFKGKAGLLRLGGLAALLAVAFVGGRGGSGLVDRITGKEAPKEVAKSSNADVDKALAGMGAASGAAGTPTGDADMDDPLIQAAGGKRAGAKGISLEQAVASAQLLVPGAKGPGDAPGAGPGASAAAGDGAPGAAGSVPLPPDTKLLLSVDFARVLAEMGQLPRAGALLKSVQAKGGSESVASAARVAQMEVQAWALQGYAETRAKQAADALMAAANAMPDPAERVAALSRIGVILSRQPQVPVETARAFLTAASEALKEVPDARRTAAMSDWTVALGESRMAEGIAAAGSGNFARTRAASKQVEEILKLAPDAPAQFRLHAIDARLKQQLGLGDKASESLDDALALAGKNATPAEQSANLRAIARLAGGVASPRMEGSMDAIRKQAIAKPGLDSAQALSNIALIYAEAGAQAKAAEVGQAVQAMPGLKAADSAVVNADLIVRTDMQAARGLHTAGMYPESEAVLQRIGDMLL